MRRPTAFLTLLLAASLLHAPAASGAADAGTPSEPLSLDVVRDPGIDQLTVSWAAPSSSGDSPVDHYYAQIDQQGYSDVGTALSKTFDGVDDGPHTIDVYASNAQGSGPVIHAGPPTAPLQVQVVPNYDGGSMEVSWKKPASSFFPITGYDILVDGTFSTTVTGGQLHTTIGGMTRGRTYRFAVRAVNKLGSGPEVEKRVAMKVKPSQPQIAEVSPGRYGGKLTAKVRWNPPSSDGSSPIDRYRVFLIKFNKRGKVVSTKLVALLGGAARQRSVTVRRRHTTYQFAVQAHNSIGWSFLSERSGPVVPQ